MPLHLGEVGLRLSGLESLSPLLDSHPSKRSPEGTMTDPIGTGPLRHQLERRRFIGAVAGGFLAAPLAAEASWRERSIGWGSWKVSRSRMLSGRVSGAHSSRKCGPADRMFR